MNFLKKSFVLHIVNNEATFILQIALCKLPTKHTDAMNNCVANILVTELQSCGFQINIGNVLRDHLVSFLL